MEDLLEEIVGIYRMNMMMRKQSFLKYLKEFMIDGSADPRTYYQLKVILPDDHNYDTMSALFVDIL